MLLHTFEISKLAANNSILYLKSVEVRGRGTGSSGAGHGGFGGKGPSDLGGVAYGDMLRPTHFGSIGGGNDIIKGGGILHIEASKSIQLDGEFFV